MVDLRLVLVKAKIRMMTTQATPDTNHSTDDVTLLDRESVLAIQKGESDRFEELISRHYGLAYSIALARLGDHDAAEDLAQEVFLRSYLNIKQLRSGEKFAPWVARLSRNLAIDWIRRGNVRSKLLTMVPLEDSDLEAPDMINPTPREELERDEQNRLLQDCVEKLNPEQRELVYLHFQQGLSQTEIAERLGVHKSTVSRKLDRALLLMRNRLEQEVVQGLKKQSPNLRSQQKAIAIVAVAAALPMNSQAALLLSASQTTALTAPVQATAQHLTFGQYVTAVITSGGPIMGTAKILVATTGAILIGSALLIPGSSFLKDQIAAAHPSPPAPVAAAPKTTAEKAQAAFQPIDEFIPWDQELRLSIENHPRTKGITLFANREEGLRFQSDYTESGVLNNTYLGNNEPEFNAVGFSDGGYYEFAAMKRTESGVSVYYQDWKNEEFAKTFDAVRAAYGRGELSRTVAANTLLSEAQKQGITPSSKEQLSIFREEFLSLMTQTMNE